MRCDCPFCQRAAGVTVVYGRGAALESPRERAARAQKLVMRAELDVLLDRCAPDEIETFLYMARRVDKARAVYGALDLDADTRDFAEEERQEHADAAMYQAFRRIQEARRR